MSERTAHICFCVEGKTEISALHYQFEDLFDSMFGDHVEVYFREPLWQGKRIGDITTLRGVTVENIEKNLYKYFFKSQDTNSDISWDDFTYIIHIIDIDGAYITKEEQIRLFTDEECKMADNIGTEDEPKNVLYFSDHIAVRNSPQAIAVRNEQKRRNIEHLRDLNEISINAKKPPKKYRLFYFSSNLDHFLFGNANLSRTDKAYEAGFFKDHVSDAELLTEFFKTNSNCKELNYCQSWDLLRKRTNSLQPLSNVNILINEILNSELGDWL